MRTKIKYRIENLSLSTPQKREFYLSYNIEPHFGGIIYAKPYEPLTKNVKKYKILLYSKKLYY